MWKNYVILDAIDDMKNWIDLVHDRDKWRTFVNVVTNVRVSQNAGNFVSSLGHVSFSGGTLFHGIS
jgi:hypothetical protein